MASYQALTDAVRGAGVVATSAATTAATTAATGASTVATSAAAYAPSATAAASAATASAAAGAYAASAKASSSLSAAKAAYSSGALGETLGGVFKDRVPDMSALKDAGYGVAAEQLAERKKKAQLAMFDMGSAARVRILFAVREMLKSQAVADPDMWNCASRRIKDGIDVFWDDLTVYIETMKVIPRIPFAIKYNLIWKRWKVSATSLLLVPQSGGGRSSCTITFHLTSLSLAKSRILFFGYSRRFLV
jgi:hypothetical protein